MSGYLFHKLYVKGYNSLGKAALSLINIPFIEDRLRSRYERAVKAHRNDIPKLSPSDAEIVEAVKRDGYYITSLAALQLPGSDAMLKATQDVLAGYEKRIERGELPGREILTANAGEMMARPEIFRWGVKERLLDIAEAYLGLPPAYDGINIFYTVATGGESADRKWHRDREDRLTLKICVYCNDVDEGGGPLQIVSKSTASRKLSDGYSYPSLSDREIEENINVPATADEAAVSCVGPTGTVVFCETGLQYHRGKPPVTRDRGAIYFHYFSRVPRHPFFCERSGLSRAQIAELGQGLGPRQMDALMWREALPPIARIVPANLL